MRSSTPAFRPAAPCNLPLTHSPTHPQVLSNEELRRKYDEHGCDGLDVNFMDGGEFFNMLFGSDQFEHLVGELLIATAAK